MRFEGDELCKVLSRQHQDVEIRPAAVLGAGPIRTVNAQYAAWLVAQDEDGYYGVGHKRRIRFLQETKKHGRDRTDQREQYLRWAHNTTGPTLVDSTQL